MTARAKRAETQSTLTPAYAQPQRSKAGTYFFVGCLCAVISLFVLPEVFGAIAVVLGGYVWRLDCGELNNRGVWVVILSLLFMLVGLYYTSLIAVGDFLP